MKIKGMDKNMRCREYQFEIGKEYKIDTKGKPLELCSDTVFHYCNSLVQVHKFYDVREDNRFFEIEVLGEEVSDSEKCGSNHIRIVREIVGEELELMKNSGCGNAGLFNSGDMNSGYMNSGDMNSGYRNSGYRNSGYMNSGDRNSGYRNSGDRNSGYRNSGYMNSGDMNSGYRNSGYRNSGDMNSGYRNSGDRNSGVANKCDGSNGVFCNEEDMNIRIFNQPSGMSLKDWYRSRYWEAMNEAPFLTTEWIWYTYEEKTVDSEKAHVGGYLKVYTMEEAWANWWAKLSEGAKKTIQEIPNFDPVIFKDITGIEI